MSDFKCSQMKMAIVGVAAQFPSGDFHCDDLSYRNFWDFLLEKRQAYEPLGPHLFTSSEFTAMQGKLNLPSRGAFLKNPYNLDTVAFGISAKDARVMPLAARRLMELSFEALADSGINYRGRKIGSFMSGGSNFEVSGAVNTDGSFISVPSALANRISYALNITGPSIQLDTACSSSLTGLHLAIQAIQTGDCIAALVGGTQINRELAEWENYSLGGVLSQDGITKPFDAGADGFGRGEGIAVVVIKPLEDALCDKDYIYSVILGSCINSTGSLMPLNVPSAIAQQECIRGAFARAGTGMPDFAELHVTGTSVGDRIETNAAGEVFPHNLDIGSVKGNIGHLEAASFLASLLKACLILEKKVIPPTVNLSKPSAAVDWDKHRLCVPTELKALPCRSDSGRSVISISGAGIGGSTGHVVIESPPAWHSSHIHSPDCVTVTFVVGGLTPKAVAHICESVVGEHLSSIRDMRACAVTLARRARQLPWRTYFTMSLSTHTKISPATLVPTPPPPIALIFSGQGPQTLEMGCGLFAAFPVFRTTILELDDIYRQRIGVSLLETTGLFVSPNLAFPPTHPLSPSAWPVTVTTAAICMLQTALFDLLASVGITPGSLAGHSAGETAILYASGAGSKAMAMEIAIARGQAMTVTESPDLGMAALSCSADVAAKIISQIFVTEGTLEICCFNSPNSVALSGPASVLEEAVSLAKSQGVHAQRIRTMVPGHSSYMDDIKDDYLGKMTEIFARYPGSHIPKIPVFSTCTGNVLVDEFTPSYFWDNCRKPVLFSTAISNLIDFHTDVLSDPIFLEVSCHPVLASLIHSHGVPEKSVVCPMHRSTSKEQGLGDEPTVFTETLAQITLLGYNCCDLGGLYGLSDYKPASITHPWVYRSIPAPKTYFSDARPTKTVERLLSTSLSINEFTHPLLAQHIINGEPVLPATGFIAILLEAGANILWDLEFISFFSLSAKNCASMILERSGYEWSLKSIDAYAALSRDHAYGLMDFSVQVICPDNLDLPLIWEGLPRLEIGGFYESLQPFASFGPAYRRVVRCHGGPSEIIAEIRGPLPHESWDGYRLAPTILDACLHIVLHPAISKRYDTVYVPSRLGRFVHHGRGSTAGNWHSYIRRRAWYPDSKSYDVVVTDGSGAVICEFKDLLVRRLVGDPPAIRRRLDIIFQPVAIPTTTLSHGPTYSLRDRQNDEESLYVVLDSLALKMISKSLQQNVEVGGNLSRQRYLEFAKRALDKRGTSSANSDRDSEMRVKYPAHFEVTARIADLHQTIFHSPKGAVDALYSDDLMARFYSRSSQTSTVYPAAVKSFSSLLDALHGGGKHVINILEVGAGTGLLTNYLIEQLQQNPHLLAEYTVTDASYALAVELTRTICYNKIIPRMYDITKDPTQQGLRHESYDVIVALHVLHAVSDIRSSLSSLKDLLVPGGTLFVIELDGTSWGDKVGSVWFDCVFGSFSEWFEFADGRTHCTMTPASWMEILQDLGFVNGHASVDGGHNFLFTAQKPSSFCQSGVTTGIAEIDPRHVLRYSFGDEMGLRSHLSNLGPNNHLELYVVALEGRDGDSAMGLCQTLRHEFPFWVIRLAIFESATQLVEAEEYISGHHNLYESGEEVIFFPRNGGPRVSRVVVSPAPDTTVLAYPTVLDDADHLLVEIITFQTTTHSINGFVGRVMASRQNTPSRGDVVVGITDKDKATIITVHIGCVLSLGTEPIHEQDLPDPVELIKRVVPILIRDCLPQRVGPPGSRIQILVASLDQDMCHMISGYFRSIDTVALVECDFGDAASSPRVDVVVTDSLTSAQYPHIRHWILRSGRFVLWDTVIQNHIRDGTWNVAQALKLSISLLPTPTESKLGDKPFLRRQSVASDQRSTSLLFHHDKSYILIGGIGGLGLDLAVWMYQHGARHLILTSRRGPSSLDPQTDAEAVAKVEYLKGRNDLVLRLEKCDGTNAHATALLVKSLSVPLAGCFQMTLMLSDGLFLNQTQASFAAVHDSKIRVFEVFAAEVELRSLDFYIAFSSLSGLVGFAGQANYSSACTVLEGMLADYQNAFSLIVPGIVDAGYLDRISSSRNVETGPAYFAGSISAARLWACVQDGLQMLRDGSRPITRYIPHLDWSVINAANALPRAFQHLLQGDQRSVATNSTGSKREEDVLQVVASFVEVPMEDLDAERPLLSYGLDSLSATRLSTALKPFLPVSQVQLLTGVSWSELRGRLREGSLEDYETGGSDYRTAQETPLTILGVDNTGFNPEFPLVSHGLNSMTTSRLATAFESNPPMNQLQLLGAQTLASDHENIVEICFGPGIPLIIFSGADGRLDPLLSIRVNFSGTLWGVQMTDSTPTSSFATLVSFLVRKIRDKQPWGPYRLAAFSASSVIAVAVAKALEESGQQVLQLCFIDHFPLLWTHEPTELLLREKQFSTLVDRPTMYAIDLLRRDPQYAASQRILELEAALSAAPHATPAAVASVAMTRRLAEPLVQFLQQFYPQNTQRSHYYTDKFADLFTRWVESVEAPLSLLVAEFGMLAGVIPDSDRKVWADLGAHRCRKSVKHHLITGVGHFGILADNRTAAFLEQYHA